MVRFGRAAMETIYDFDFNGRGSFFLRKEAMFASVGIRALTCGHAQDFVLHLVSKSPPVRISSGGGKERGLASLTCVPLLEAPLILRSQAYRALNCLAITTSKMYIFELFAAVATIFAHEEAAKQKTFRLYRQCGRARA